MPAIVVAVVVVVTHADRLLDGAVRTRRDELCQKPLEKVTLSFSAEWKVSPFLEYSSGHVFTRSLRRSLMLSSALSRFTVFQRVLFAVLVVAAVAAFTTARPQADVSTVVKPNYDLASQWTGEKVGKLLFDTSVTPRWFEGGDRFWYTFQTHEGRKFYLVEPAKKSKAPLFDHAKMAATLTQMIGQPYETAHLPFSTVQVREEGRGVPVRHPGAAHAHDQRQADREAEDDHRRRSTTRQTRSGRRIRNC